MEVYIKCDLTYIFYEFVKWFSASNHVILVFKERLNLTIAF